MLLLYFFMKMYCEYKLYLTLNGRILNLSLTHPKGHAPVFLSHSICLERKKSLLDLIKLETYDQDGTRTHNLQLCDHVIILRKHRKLTRCHFATRP